MAFPLTEEQKRIVDDRGGELLVSAAAGSGKTRVLTFRIAHMLGDLGVKPWQILAITFTNKAAAEMRERLAALIPSGTRGMWVCTFHAMCVRMLREDADLLGYTGQFTIYDDDDSRRMVREIMTHLGIEQKQYPINMIRSKISTAKNAMIGPEELIEKASSPQEQKAAQVYLELERRLRAANAMDFDDLLVRTLELLRTRPEVLEKYQERFRYISVDEYQDTNHVQYEIANLLAAKYQNLMVVGDDDQSIYSWRGADISNILDFEKDFKQAKVVKLEQNYRSTGHILAAANAVVRNNSRRKEKRLFTDLGDGEKIQAYQASDERDEGRWIASEIEKLRAAGTSYDDMAVFYRTNAQSRILEDMFLRAGVPYKIVGGTRFFDRAEIRDVMAYLKMIVNPADEMSAKRVINTPRRGIGSTSIGKIEDLARMNACSFFQACELAIAETGMFSAKVRHALGDFVNIVREGRRMDGELKDVVEMIVDKSGLVQAFRAEGTMEAESRAENIQEFLGVAAEFEETHEDIEGTLESLEELRAAGVPKENIWFIIALGTHGVMYRTEFVRKLGEEIVENYEVHNHNLFFNHVFVGNTTNNVPVEINADVMSADYKIAIGTTMAHSYYGFSGGAKCILPGVSSLRTIMRNHSFTTTTEFNMGNPHTLMRSDAEQAARMMGLDFKIDAILNGHAQICNLFAGDFEAEIQHAAAYAAEHYAAKFVPDCDVVIANNYFKPAEANCAYTPEVIASLKDGGSFVLAANSPFGPCVHFLYDKWGHSAPGGMMWSGCYTKGKNMAHAVVFAEHTVKGMRDPWYIDEHSGAEYVKTWSDALRILDDGTPKKVVLYPNAECQVLDNSKQFYKQGK